MSRTETSYTGKAILVLVMMTSFSSPHAMKKLGKCRADYRDDPPPVKGFAALFYKFFVSFFETAGNHPVPPGLLTLVGPPKAPTIYRGEQPLYCPCTCPPRTGEGVFRPFGFGEHMLG